MMQQVQLALCLSQHQFSVVLTQQHSGRQGLPYPLFPFAGFNLIRFNGSRFRGLSPVGTPTSAGSITAFVTSGNWLADRFISAYKLKACTTLQKAGGLRRVQQRA